MLVNRLFFLILGLLFLLTVINKVKRKIFSEKESFFWVVASIFMLILSIFPSLITKLAKIVHIEYPPSLLFLLGIIFTMYLVFRLTQQISLLSGQIKELAQRNAILEKRVQDCEINRKHDI